ncbi:hypothetical protein ACH5RR_031403 [Cinchona calisaya]|uniref:Pentatricopeptide repeat-containing protein n=1 Tax=Cinchona calisaya TaxID=153742 RepID=A0ABD2YH34_9GENT
MLVKFQHFETITNCFYVPSSAKATTSNINIGVSVTPIKKQNDQNPHIEKLQKQRKLIHTSKIVKKDGGKNGFIKNPVGKIVKDDNFEVEFVEGSGHGNQSSELCDGKYGGFRMTQNGFGGNLDGSVEKNGNLEGKCRPNGGHGAVLEESCDGSSPNKNGGLKTGTDGFWRNPDGKKKNERRIWSEERSGNLIGGVAEKVQIKCSTKWLRYGGCIPAIMEALERVSDLDEAFKPWDKSLSNKERSIILKEQKGWERAMEIFEWFKGKGCYEVNVIHYNIMLRILGKSRRWDDVERLLDEMGERRIEPINSTYGTLIDVYSKGGRRKDAMKWLELMKNRGMEPDEVTLGIVVQMYKKAGEFQKAEEFFKMWSIGKSAVKGQGNDRSGNAGAIIGDSRPPVSLSSITYNNLIDTYGKAGKVKEACQIFDQMLREGIVPTTVTFNTMIHMCGNNGQLEEVSSLTMKMEDLQCPPDTRTFNILIFLHAKHNDIHTAANYFKKMKAASLEPDAVSYRTLVYAFSIRHMVVEAEELISEMDERGLEIDEFTQSALTRMYIEAGMLENSWMWFHRFHLLGNMTPECYSANIDAFGEHGYVVEAEKVFNCCQEWKKLSVLVFNVMIKAYGISKRYDEACCLFDNMEQHGIVPDRCSCNSLIHILASADMPEKAICYVRKMQEAGLVDDCIPYCSVISSFTKLGKLAMAVGLYKEMISFNIQPDVVVYGVLLNAFADTGSVKETTIYLDEMRNAGMPPNAVIYNSLIKLYTKVGYLKEAQETFQILETFEVGPDLYSSNCMIDLYSERSMIRQAEEGFENLRRKGHANEFSYAMMLCMYRRNGRFFEAIKIAQKMRELGLLTDVLSFNNVLGLYASDGRYKEATETFKEMLISAIQPDDCTFKALGIILVKCGVSREAIRKLELMRKKDSKRGLRRWSSTLFSVVGASHES